MVLDHLRKNHHVCIAISLFFGLICLLVAPEVHAQQDAPQPVQQDSSQPANAFPGFNEVVPKATAVTAKLTEAETQIQNLEARQSLYDTLDALAGSLKELEDQYSDWEDVANWQINRLLRAQSIYDDLGDQLGKPLDDINTQLQTLENLRADWDQQKTYWQGWHEHLSKSDVKIPNEVFQRTKAHIDELLKRVARVASELVKAQQKYTTGKEIITSRLNTIDKTLDTFRRDSFRRNTFTMFEADYYRQFNREMVEDFSQSLVTSTSLPANTFARHGGVIGLQILSIVIIALLLIYRKNLGKPLTKEWSFLFQRPLSGGIFISIVFTGIFTELQSNLPLTWKWLILMALIIATMRLLNAFYAQPQAKTLIRVIASIYMISESLRFFGLPTPLLQLYNATLCGVAIPICWHLIRTKHQGLRKQRIAIHLIFAAAIIGLVSSLLGFESLSTNLIDATLSTFIVVILVRMALSLSNNGIASFMQMDWVKNRHFMQVLGLEAGTQKLQTLLRIFILLNSGLYMLVVWMIFDNLIEARDAILGFEYSFGEFSISIKMVTLVVVILYLTTIFSWVVQAFIDSQIMTPKKMDLGVKESLKRLTHYGLFTIGFLIAASMAGLDLQKFTILAGALGVGIGFGLQNIVNNFVSGLILLFERPVKIGDTITIGTEWGTIKKIGLRSTIFETFDRSEIIVPNADLISQQVTNWTFSSRIVRVNLPVGVAYGSPLEKVLEILNRAAREHPDVLSYPEPSAVFEGFGNSSIDFKLRFWVHTVDDRLRIFSDVGVILDRLFREEGIEIPFPQRDLHLRSIDGNLQTLFGQKPAASTTTADTPSETEGPTE